MNTDKEVWYTEPRLKREDRTLILEKHGKRFVCPLINRMQWSIMALRDLADNHKLIKEKQNEN